MNAFEATYINDADASEEISLKFESARRFGALETARSMKPLGFSLKSLCRINC